MESVLTFLGWTKVHARHARDNDTGFYQQNGVFGNCNFGMGVFGMMDLILRVVNLVFGRIELIFRMVKMVFVIMDSTFRMVD